MQANYANAPDQLCECVKQWIPPWRRSSSGEPGFMNPSSPLPPWRSLLVQMMRLVSLLAAVSAGCGHTVDDMDDFHRAIREANSNDRMEIDEDGLNAAICAQASGPTSTDGSCPETDIPGNMSSPLLCPHPKTSAGGHALCLQCAVRPGVKADSVLLHYRKPAEGQWSSHSLPMRRTPTGWFRATIPALVMSGHELYVHYEALDGIDRVAEDGQWDSPHVITICGGR